MKLGRISVESPDGPTARLVLVLPEEQRVIDLRRASVDRLTKQGATREGALAVASAIFPGSMSKAISNGDLFQKAAAEILADKPDEGSIPFDKVSWLPATDPSVVRDGLTFIDHIKGFHEKMKVAPATSLLQVPGYFKGTPWTLFGHDTEIPWPGFINFMDYELELGWVIGRRGHNVHPDQALNYLFGVTIFNDFSARDRQGIEFPIGMGPQKCKDFAYGVGPWITTVDEFDELSNLGFQIRVNGEVWSSGKTGEQLWSVPELIAYVSLADWIEPGDVIGSGTVGNGSALEIDRKLSPGDILELEVENIGILRNKLGQPQNDLWAPDVRKPFM